MSLLLYKKKMYKKEKKEEYSNREIVFYVKSYLVRVINARSQRSLTQSGRDSVIGA